MANITWIGGTSGDWYNANNWQGGVIPGQNDTAYINSSVAGQTVTVTFSQGNPTVGGIQVTASNSGGINLSQLTGNLTSPLGVTVIGGGSVDLSGVTSITGSDSIISQGSGSQINLSNLTSFQKDPNNYYSYGTLEVDNGGTINLSNLSSLTGVTLNSSGSGTVLNLPSLTSDVRNSATNTTPYQINISATNGGSVQLPSNVTNLDNLTITVNGATLDLSQVTSINNTNITVTGGGSVDLSGVTSITGSDSIISQGSGSQINLSNLTSFQKDPNNYYSTGTLEVDNGGTINLSNLSSLTGVNLNSSGTGTVLNLPSLTSDVHNSATNTNPYQINISATNGGSVQLPNDTLLEDLNITSNNGTLSLPSVTALSGTVDATNGGQINLQNANFIPTNQNLQADADGSGSLVNISTLPSNLSPLTISQTNSGVVLTATTVQGNPDLIVSSITVPTNTQPSQTINVSWTDQNIGNVPVQIGWNDSIYLAQNNLTSASSLSQDTLLATVPVGLTSDLLVNGSYTQNDSVTLPTNLVDGNYYIVVDTNSQQQVTESNQNNNITASNPITIGTSQLPDLTVSSVTAPTTAQFGQTLNISWTDENLGNVAVTTSYVDSIYLAPNNSTSNLSNDTLLLTQTVNPGNNLVAGGSYTQNASVTLPLNSSVTNGNYYLVVQTNATNSLLEFNVNNDVTASNAVALTVPPLPDLTVSSVVVPSSAQFGQTLNISWTDQNIGNAAVSGSWSDRIYLAANNSTDPNNLSNDTLLLTQLVNDPNGLQAGGSSTQNASVTLPLNTSLTSGNYYLIVQTNALNSVLESNPNNDITASNITNIIVNAPPVLTGGSVNNLNVLENSSTTSLGLSGLTYSPGQVGQTLTYTVTGLPDASLGTIYLADGITPVTTQAYTLSQLQGFTFKPTLNANNNDATGSNTLSFTVAESGGTATGGQTTLNQSLNINVLPVNQAPIQTGGNLENLLVPASIGLASLGFSGLTYGPGGGSDQQNQTLTYTITGLPNANLGQVVLADGVTPVATNDTYTLTQLQGLEFSPSINASTGTSQLTFQVNNNGGTANGGQDILNQSVNISVEQVSITPNQPANAVIGSHTPVVGNPGNNRIEGGIGTKTLTGGSGSNVFVFSSLQEVGQEITNFTVGKDEIDLSGLLSSLGYSGSNGIAAGYVKLIQGSTSNTTILEIDRAPGSAIFRPFLELDNVTPTQMNSTSNFIF
jgi:hypothetical protein